MVSEGIFNHVYTDLQISEFMFSFFLCFLDLKLYLSINFITLMAESNDGDVVWSVSHSICSSVCSRIWPRPRNFNKHLADCHKIVTVPRR